MKCKPARRGRGGCKAKPKRGTRGEASPEAKPKRMSPYILFQQAAQTDLYRKCGGKEGVTANLRDNQQLSKVKHTALWHFCCCCRPFICTHSGAGVGWALGIRVAQFVWWDRLRPHETAIS